MVQLLWVKLATESLCSKFNIFCLPRVNQATVFFFFFSRPQSVQLSTKPYRFFLSSTHHLEPHLLILIWYSRKSWRAVTVLYYTADSIIIAHVWNTHVLMSVDVRLGYEGCFFFLSLKKGYQSKNIYMVTGPTVLPRQVGKSILVIC